MKSTIKFALFSSALALAAMPALAQSDTQSTPVTGKTIQERKDNQQNRIANGVQSGQLTAGEAANLEKKESTINKEEGAMRAVDGGKLTNADKAAINRQQNRLSNQIYADKHNAATQSTSPTPKSEVGARQENQQERIANGVKSGQLTAGEAAHLERNEARINNEVRNDRAANGGKLTAQQKAKINRQMNRESRQIYRDKHNGRHQ